MKNLTYLILLACLFSFFSCDNNTTAITKELEDTKKELADAKKMLEVASAATDYKPGFIHTVFFWYNEGVSEEDKKQFMEGLRSLSTIESVRKFYIGPPAMTPREVVDNSYQMALVVHFDDVAGHDLYQEAQIHLDFIEASKHVWKKVQVYDNFVE